MKMINKRWAITKKIFENAYNCQVHSQENYYIGKECLVEYAEKALKKFKFAKLHRNGPGHYIIHVTDRCWYEFESSI